MDDTIIVLSLSLVNGNCRNCCFWNEMAENKGIIAQICELTIAERIRKTVLRYGVFAVL
jgi:hypothetical protein